MRRRRVLPGFGLSLGTSVLFVSLVLLLPMTALVVQLSELTWAQYWAILTHPQTTAAFRVTILSAFWASTLCWGSFWRGFWCATGFPGADCLTG